jgi:hypothetical protein
MSNDKDKSSEKPKDTAVQTRPAQERNRFNEYNPGKRSNHDSADS